MDDKNFSLRTVQKWLVKTYQYLLPKLKNLYQCANNLKVNLSHKIPSNAILPPAVLAFDTLMAFLAVFIGLYLRIGEEFLDYTPSFLLKNMFVFALVSGSIFSWMGTYKAIWRYVSIEDMVPLSLASFLAALIYFPLMILMGQSESLPRSMPILIAIVLIFLLGLPRFAFRMVHENQLAQKRRQNAILSMPVLLVGSDDATELFIRESLHNPEVPYHPIGIISLTDEETGRHIHGVPILGEVREFNEILGTLEQQQQMPKQIIITAEQLSDEQKTYISNHATTYGLTLLHVLQHFSWDIISNNTSAEEPTS